MAGGIMQLVAYGVQDVYLTGNPQITYWKVIYKRHTNFAVEPIEQSFSGTADFGKTSVTSLIARNGDLMTKVYLKATIQVSQKSGSGGFAFVRRVGLAMIKWTEVQIGGASIDKVYGDWMNVWYELSHSISKERGYSLMIGDTPYLTELSTGGLNGDSAGTKTATIFVPLTFWFCRNNGLALPLIALQYHDVRINFNFNPASSLVVTENGTTATASITDAILLIDYVFLDSEERKRFATAAHEYLIEQLQTPDSDTIAEQNKKIRLPFNHPCKEIVWNVVFGKYITNSLFLAYHPTDYTFIRQRFAEMLFLLSLNASKNPDGTWYLQADVSSTNMYSFMQVSSVSAINDLVATIQRSAVIVTKQASEINISGTELPADFSTNPFSYVEFIDDSWKQLTLDMISTPVFAQGSVAGLGIDSSLPLYTLLSAFFVNVNMPFNYGLYIDGTVNPIDSGNIQLNGQDRFTIREGNYFNYVQPYQHHSNTPADGINLYSFALNPEEHQPSGSCNFSRIDFSQLNIKTTTAARNVLGDSSIINIYTINYNILRIMGGMGGLNTLGLKVASQHNFGNLCWVNLLCSQCLTAASAA